MFFNFDLQERMDKDIMMSKDIRNKDYIRKKYNCGPRAEEPRTTHKHTYKGCKFKKFSKLDTTDAMR